MSVRTRPIVRLAALRAAAHRFSSLLLILAALGLMILGKVDTVLVDTVRARVTDVAAPILSVIARPASGVANVVEDARELAELRAQNARLRQENMSLLRFQEVAYRLEAENEGLRTLLNYRPAHPNAYLSARVIADDSGTFVRSVAIALGAENGVRDGMAALGGYGLAGRTVQTGERSARVLLLTDLNARIPVLLERSRERGILAGDNTDLPQLLYLPDEAAPEVGERVVTSGHGGMFPPGIPVGTIAAVDGRQVRVRPFENADSLDFVRIVDFHPGVQDARLRSSLAREVLSFRGPSEHFNPLNGVAIGRPIAQGDGP